MDFLKFVKEGEIIKFYTSPKIRCQETAGIMQKVIEEKIKGGLNIRLLGKDPVKKEEIKNIDLNFDYAKEARLAGKDIISYWLEDTQNENLEKAEDVEKRFKETMERFNKIVSRLKQDEPKIHIVLVSHGEFVAPYMDKTFSTNRLDPAK